MNRASYLMAIVAVVIGAMFAITWTTSQADKTYNGSWFVAILGTIVVVALSLVSISRIVKRWSNSK